MVTGMAVATAAGHNGNPLTLPLNPKETSATLWVLERELYTCAAEGCYNASDTNSLQLENLPCTLCAAL